MRRLVLGVALAAALGGRAVAQDQPAPAPPKAAPAAKVKPGKAPDLAQQMGALEADLKVAAADASAARQAVTELEARVTTLEAALAKLQGSGQTTPEDRAVIDKLVARVGDLERALSEVRAQAALTPQPSPEAEAAGGEPPAGYEGGFYLRSPDERFTAVLNAWLRFGYQLDHVSAGGGQNAHVTKSGFALDHARLTMSGNVYSHRLEYAVSTELADKASLRDAYVDYREQVTFRAGQFKVPFSREALAPDAELVFAEPAAATANAPGRDIGVEAYGALLRGRLGYQLAVVNGGGLNAPNENIDTQETLRLTYAPMGPLEPGEGDFRGSHRPKIELSAALLFDLTTTGDVDGDGKLDDVDGDGRPDNTRVLALDAALAARWHGASLEGEYILRSEDEGVGRPIRKLHSWFAQAAYALPLYHVMAGVRYGQLAPTPVGLSKFERAALPKTRRELSAVIGYTRRGHRMEAQLELSLLQDELQGGTKLDSQRGLAVLQVAF